MRRRDFITVIAGLGAVWPLTLTARAQQPQRMRRIGVIIPGTADDAEYQARMAAFLQELQQLGSGPQAMPIFFANMRPNWLRLSLMLSWPLAARVWACCYKRPAPCRLYSRLSLIQLAPVSSRVWRGPAVMPSVSSHSNTA